MHLDHRVIAKISRMLDRINTNVMLLDNNGQVILPEDNHREFTLPEAIRQNPTEPLVFGGFTLMGTEGTRPLFLVLPGDSTDVCNCAVLAAEIINMLTRMDLSSANREQGMRCILRDEVEGAELETLAMEHAIPLDRSRVVLMIHLGDIDTAFALSIMHNVAQEESGDMVVEMDRHTVLLIKQLDEEQAEYDEMEQLGSAIQNTFFSETSKNVYVGIGEPKQDLIQLSESYREARKAIDVGRTYRADENVFVYRKLMLERFLADIPAEMRIKYHRMMFNRKTMRLFNEEMLNTIEKFFENSLNLSETARQIFIHRNTLVYRLDKVQRLVGLDLRAFDDAVTFKLMLLMGRGAPDKNRYY